MLEVLPGPDHVLAFRVSGKLTGDDYDRISRELNARLKKHERIGLVTDAVELEGMTPAALAKDLRYGFARFGEFHRFPRGAIITDKKWLRLLAGLGDAALPQTEIRTFEPQEREAALAWVAELPDQTRTPALRIMPTTRPDTFAFVWNGRLSAEDMEEFVNVLKPAMEAHDKVRLLGRMDRLGGLVPGVITESGLLSLKRTIFRKIERYAIVGGPAWLKRYVGFAHSVTGFDIRYFDAASENDAWAWLEARPIDPFQPRAASIQ